MKYCLLFIILGSLSIQAKEVSFHGVSFEVEDSMTLTPERNRARITLPETNDSLALWVFVRDQEIDVEEHLKNLDESFHASIGQYRGFRAVKNNFEDNEFRYTWMLYSGVYNITISIQSSEGPITSKRIDQVISYVETMKLENP